MPFRYAKPMRRILLLITDLEIGGTPTVVRELAIRLRAAGGCEVEVACLKGWGPVATQLQQAGVTVKAFAATAAMDFSAVVGELRQYIRDRNIDTVFSFLVHSNAVAAMASRGMTGVRWLQSIQTTQPSPRWHWWLQRVAQLAADKVVVPSESVAQAARDWADVPGEKIVVVPNAVDVFRNTDVSPVSARAKKVGFIGRLDPVKRIPDLIAAVAQLPTDVTLDVWGEGSARKEIEFTVAKFGLADRVTLHGAIASPAVALQQIDCLVLPSMAEGFGLVLIEAMNAGVPVVATNVAGIRDVVRHEYNGLLVPVNNPASLAAAIGRVLAEPALREKLIANGHREVAARFSWDRVLAMYRAALEIVPS